MTELATPFVSMTELQARLGFDLDAELVAEAEDALWGLSYEAAHHGRREWIENNHAPPLVKELIIRAAKRYLKNPDGYNQSRAADETVGWREREGMEDATFTAREISMIRSLGRARGFGTVSTFAWGSAPADPTGYVPTEGGTPFPYFRSEEGPW